MAATLTGSGDLTYISFDIEKVESTPDGDLMVYGRATDGSVDHDQQIVDPGFSSKAIADWLATGGNVRVQHNPQRDPAGVGMEAHTDESGATWVKSLICEPVAKKLVSKGALRAYSVGIANPTIERDMTGKARGGIIKSGQIVEISLVDRPANASCGIQLVKSVDGTPEASGQLFGDENAIIKALNKSAGPSVEESVNNIDSYETPNDISLDFTPNDLMRILADKTSLRKIVDLEKEILGKDHRDFSADRRRELAGQGNSLPDGSYPIPDKDALRRAAILARSGHGNVGAARRLIARRAKELGVANPLSADDEKILDEELIVKDAVPESCEEDTEENSDGPHKIPKPVKPMEHKAAASDDGDDAENDDDEDDNCKEATPDVVKDPADGDGPGPAKPKKGKKGKKLPPWLNDGKSDKCHTPPDQAAGVSHDMEAAPVGELQESPKPDHMKSAALMRYKTIGMDTDLGILHDFLCPAFHPGEVAKYFPGVTVASAIDEEIWQRKALAAATGKSIAEAMEAQHIWQAAVTLKAADQAEVDEYRMELHKAFRDANPGPTSGCNPGSISPQKFNRPCITDGHSANGSGYDGPNSSPSVATSAPNAHHFDRPPLGSEHQSPSPSHMKGGMEYPSEQGVPTKLDYAAIEKDKARRALSMLHDHLNHMFPSSCPMLDQDAYRQEQPTVVPPTAGVGKSAEVEVTVQGGEEVLGDVYKYIAKLEKKVRAGEITEKEARDRLSKRTAKKYAESLTKQVQKGMTSRDEVLRALGIEPPAEKVETVPVDSHEVTKAATVAVDPQSATAGLTPDVMKSMMTEILQPLQEKIAAQEQRITEQNDLLTKYNEQFEGQQKELEQHKARWDALANQPDPSSAAFSGLALNPLQRTRPEGVVKAADGHERVQGMMMRQLERAWRTSENPAEREAAYTALMKYKNMDS